MNPPDPHVAPRLPRRLASRVFTLWPVKMFGTMLSIMAFFHGYFWVMRHPGAEVFTMPLTAIDAWVPVQESALWMYASLWVYVALGPALGRNGRDLLAYGMGSLFMSLAGFAIFYLWPTAVPAFPVDWTLYPSLQFLKAVDVAGNACPSLHVSFAVFTAAVIHWQLRALRTPRAFEVVNVLWALGIVYSTLATRQHVALDVLAGVLFALPALWVHAAVVGAGRRPRAVPAAVR